MQARDIKSHVINKNASVRDVLLKLNSLRVDAVLFVVDEQMHLLGTLTDGDLRRGFIRGLTFDSTLFSFIEPDPLYVLESEIHALDIMDLRNRNFLIVPVVNAEMVIVKVLNLRITYSDIPVDVIIMAGGRGQRLMPLTQNTPKPMLRVGSKPILEHQVNHLIKYGIKNITISVNYLADQIIDHFGDGSAWGVNINYIREDKPLGTLGSLKLAASFSHNDLLITNSDILTNIDLASFFHSYMHSNAEMAVAATSYYVDVPYGVLEVDSDNAINAIREKPQYSYYSNAGIYLAKKELISMIPADEVYNVTDLMQQLINSDRRIVSYPILGYWLDIGKMDDYKKAQLDIHYLAI